MGFIKRQLTILKESIQRMWYYLCKSGKFIEWDYCGLLEVEKAWCERFVRIYTGYKYVDQDILSKVNTYIRLLDIVMDNVSYLERENRGSDLAYNWKMLRYVNIRNKDRYVDKGFNNIIDNDPESPILLSELYRIKAWKVCNDFRQQYLLGWWLLDVR